MRANFTHEDWSWMFKAWIENITDEGGIDRHLVYFDLNHNMVEDTLMKYRVNNLAEKIRNDIRSKTTYPVGTVITWTVRFNGRGPLYSFAAIWAGKKWYTTGQNMVPMTAEQMGAYLAGTDVVSVQLATGFDDVL